MNFENSDQTRQEVLSKYKLMLNKLYEDISSQNKKYNYNDSFSCFNMSTFFENCSQKKHFLIHENTDFFELLQTCGNTQLNKLILVFASLIEEMNDLATFGAQKFIGSILLYREDSVINSTVKEAIVLDMKIHHNQSPSKIEEDDEYSAVAKLLPILFELICYLKRCYEVASNLLMQQHTILTYANIKTNDKQLQSTLRHILPHLSGNIRFDMAWEALGNLATTLINLDQIFSQQLSQNIQKDIFNYKRSLEMVLKDLEKFGLKSKENEIQVILTIIVEIERELIDGFIAGGASNGNDNIHNIGFFFFKGLIVALMNTNIAENGCILRNNYLNENMASYVKNNCYCIEQNQEKFVDSYRFLSVTIFYVLYVHLFLKESDKKLLKILIDVQKKLNIFYVHLPGNIYVAPDHILFGTLPRQLIEKKLFDYFMGQREQFLKVGYIESQIKSLIPIIDQWLVKTEQSLNSGFYNNITEGDALNQIFIHLLLIKEGFEFIRLLSNLIQNCINVYYQFQRSLSKFDTIALCKAITLLKGIKKFFYNHKKIIFEVVLHYQKYNACALLNILTRTKRRILNNVTNYSEQKLDLLSAIILISNCLNGPVTTSKRYTLMSLCFSYTSSHTGIFAGEDLSKIQVLLRKIEFFLSIFPKISQMFDCHFLYFNREIIKVYFKNFYDTYGISGSSSICELQYFFAAIDDAIRLLESVGDSEISQKLLKAYQEDILQMFKTNFLNPIFKDFEDELRFLTHLDLQLGEKNPFKRKFKDFKMLLSSEPLKLFNGRIIIWLKSYFENSLNELAYNMTTIALHDWKTYESMLGYARAKFGLNFASLQLPTRTLEQGLDVLEVTRNIHIFVAAYLYNLNNQVFVERSSANKHLNVLTIRHVANSIQTHGFGIINSTVNFAYQFLKKKLQILSQFLHEEHIKSRLIKDIRQFREMVAAEEKQGTAESSKLIKFSFEKAEKLVKNIRKLGVTKDGLTYLDKFRQLLTQIGNVLGFVRMLRSGAMHCTSEIANFVPDLDDLNSISFEKLVCEELLSSMINDETIQSARNLDSALYTVATNYSDATDYFKLLVEVFAPTFRDPKNTHLKNFYVILPATTYNYVEHITLCKEKLARKNKQDGAAFTDDGFSVGVVYVLKLLNQLQDFDSLQWFASVDDYVKKTMPNNKIQSSENLSSQFSQQNVEQTQSLTIKRIEMFHQEFQLLKFNLTNSKILFKSAK